MSLSTHTQSSHVATADESCSDGDKKMPACCWGEAPGRLHGRVNVLISTISSCVSNHPSLSNHANYSYYLNTHTDTHTHTLQCKWLWDSSLNGGNKIKRVTCVYAQVCLLMKVGADWCTYLPRWSRWFWGLYIQEALHLHIYILITLHFIMMNPICKNVCTTRGNYIIVAGVPE